MKVNIGITDKNRQAVATILNVLLADEQVLYTKTRSYHWNYIGDNFIELHKLFEAHYDTLGENADAVAERIRTIGHFPEGRMKDFLKSTHLDEPDYTSDQTEQIRNLVMDHESIIISIRKSLKKVEDTYDDKGTADFMTGLLKEHEKMAWMLRSYLKG